MNDSSDPFKKAGITLLCVGLIDIGVMVYCIVNKISYSSSFNMFAVIAGILLIKGNVYTVRIVRWLSVFIIAAYNEEKIKNIKVDW